MLTRVISSKYSAQPVCRKVTGFTLIEVLITIVVIGIAATAIMSVFIGTVKTSVDPIIQQQAISISAAYMEEIQAQSFADPTGVDAGEVRATFDDVDDYNGLIDIGAKDQNNSPITGLEGYTVSVSVSNQAFNGISATNAKRIDVTVSHSAIDDILLSGFRVNH